jgi:DNA-binding response OmpR family regulator
MKSILIIDDDRELILEMEEILTEEGFIIEKTHDPLVGKNMMLVKLYDIVLLDYKMPGMNGIDLLGDIKQHKKKPAVILITGSLNMEKLIEDAGCDSLVKAVFTKPFDIDELITTLKKI